MKPLWRIIRFTGELRAYYVGISLFTILIAATTQLVPLLTKAAIDQITNGLRPGGHVNVTIVAGLAALIFVTDMLTTVFSNFGGYIGDMLAIKLQRLLSNRYYDHIMSLPQRYFDTELTGTIINRMSRGIQQITDFAQTLSNNFLQFVFSTIFTLVIVAYYSWPVAVLLFLLYPIFIWMTAKTSSKWQGYQKKINRDLDVASGRFAESVSQVRVVKSYGQEARELLHFDRLMKRVVRTTKPQSKYWHQQDTLRRTVLAIIFFAAYSYIFIETARGRYGLGTMVLLIQYAQLIRIPIFSISFLVDRFQRAIANTSDYFAVLDELPEVADRPNAPGLQISQGAIRFDRVTFGYDDSHMVLSDLTFSIVPDTKVALVGESGEGKTTITSLLLRLYQLHEGSIYVDDQDVAEVTQASLRQHISVVFQEPALFSGTIRENIAYARAEASEAEIVAAATAANAHEFIEKFEHGYDSQIGERGLKLSGGQKQRIAIARALLKNAPILILDEATSSLDSKSERMVHQALERLMKGRTTLIIAHRLSTIQNVDQIITIQNGRVDEIGAPAELAVSGGIYSQLLALQQGHGEKAKQKLQAYEIAE